MKGRKIEVLIEGFLEGSDKVSNVDGLISFNDRITDLFESMEKQEGFRSSEGWLNGIMYDLYSKTKRAFQTSNVILNSDIPNNYIEVLPQLRIILESYLHSNYIRLNKSDGDRLEQEYKDHLAYQQWRLGRTLNELKEESPKEIDDYDEYIQSFFEGKPKRNRVQHLESIKDLSKKIHQFELYAEVYTMLSGYVHYNPQTRHSYGVAKDNETFSYSKFEYNEALDIRIRKYILDFTISVIRNMTVYFELKEFMRGDFFQVDNDWRFIVSRVI